MMISELEEKKILSADDVLIVQNETSGDYTKFPATAFTVPFMCLFPSNVSVLYMSTIISRVQAVVEQISADRSLVTFNVRGTLSFSTDSVDPVELTLTSEKFNQESDGFCLSCSCSSATGINGTLTADFSEGEIHLNYSLYDSTNHSCIQNPVSISNGNPFTVTDFKCVFLIPQGISNFS